MKNILLIEDEQSIADTICYALQADSFSVVWKNLGRDGIAYFQQHPVDLIILDVGLPDMNGFDVCKALRTLTETPIIFLTARSDEIDRVVGLEMGADDYVVKPFSPRELVARVKVRLKRSLVLPENRGPLSVFDIDENKQRITFDGNTLDLTRYEYCLLALLLSQPERIFSREQLMQQIWDSPEHVMDRTVDAHIKTLRAKLRRIRPKADLIKTHRSMGYSIAPF
jgi:two-component system catabolic regulation response regulator CreB